MQQIERKGGAQAASCDRGLSQPITELNGNLRTMYTLKKAVGVSLQVVFVLLYRSPSWQVGDEKMWGGAWRMSPPSKRRWTNISYTDAVHLQEPLTAPLACRTATIALRSVRMWHGRPHGKRESRFQASLCERSAILDTLSVFAKQVCRSLDRTCQEIRCRMCRTARGGRERGGREATGCCHNLLREIGDRPRSQKPSRRLALQSRD